MRTTQQANWASDSAAAPWPSPQAPAPVARLSTTSPRELRRPTICAAAAFPTRSQEDAPTPDRRPARALRCALTAIFVAWGALMVGLYLLPRSGGAPGIAEAAPVQAPARVAVAATGADVGDPAVGRFAWSATCEIAGGHRGGTWRAVRAVATAREQASWFAPGVVPAAVVQTLAAPSVSDGALAAIASACTEWSARLTAAG